MSNHEQPPSSTMKGDVVGYLEVHHPAQDSLDTQERIEICGDEQFYVGRNTTLCRYHWDDPIISNKHLRIHCIVYEEQPEKTIAPFVYATDVSSNGTILKKHITHDTIQLKSVNRPYLLDVGDELQLPNAVVLTYHSLVQDQEEALDSLQKEEARYFERRYLITDRVLGIGGQGKVLAAIHRKSQQQLACKVVDISTLQAQLQTEDSHIADAAEEPGAPRGWPTQIQKRFREFEVLQDLSHPNIVSIEKVFFSQKTIYIFQSLVTGGDLFSYVGFHGGKLGEVESAVVVKQILEGLHYLHEHDIVHRDLKLDNILMTSIDNTARVVITDFGAARFLPTPTTPKGRRLYTNRRMFSLVGTLEYAAPELHKMNKTIPEDCGYSAGVDIWAVGCITAVLLSGDHLFIDRQDPTYVYDPRSVILGRSSECDLRELDDPLNPQWKKVSERPKAFIKRLLVLQEEHRLTADEALTHPWLSNKTYAAELDAYYKRVTQDWQPPRKIFKLIKSIPDNEQDTGCSGIPGQLSNSMVSKLFQTPLKSRASLNAGTQFPRTPVNRANTPLPSILEDHEDYEDSLEDVSMPPLPESYEIPDSDENMNASPPSIPSEDHINDSMDQLTLDAQSNSNKTSNPLHSLDVQDVDLDEIHTEVQVPCSDGVEAEYHNHMASLLNKQIHTQSHEQRNSPHTHPTPIPPTQFLKTAISPLRSSYFTSRRHLARPNPTTPNPDPDPYPDHQDHSDTSPSTSVVPETPVAKLIRRRTSVYETTGRKRLYDEVSQESAERWVSARRFAQEVEKRRKVVGKEA